MAREIEDPELPASGSKKGARALQASFVLSGLCAVGVILILPLGLLNVPLLSMLTVVGCLPVAALVCAVVAQAYRAPGAWQAVALALALVAGVGLVAVLIALMMGYPVGDLLR